MLNKTPEQYQFKFALWTVEQLRIVFHQQFRVCIIQTTVRRILRTMRLSCQWPKRRTLRYSLQAVTVRMPQSFLGIVRHAQEMDATIVFADEAGLDSMCVYSRTWGKKGETPIVRVTNSKF